MSAELRGKTRQRVNFSCYAVRACTTELSAFSRLALLRERNRKPDDFVCYESSDNEAEMVIDKQSLRTSCNLVDYVRTRETYTREVRSINQEYGFRYIMTYGLAGQKLMDPEMDGIKEPRGNEEEPPINKEQPPVIEEEQPPLIEEEPFRHGREQTYNQRNRPWEMGNITTRYIDPILRNHN